MKRLLTILFSVVLSVSVWADVRVTLRSGETLTGAIVFQNEEVLVLKNADGQRFQYPMAEVVSVEDGVAAEQEEEEQESGSRKKVGVSLHLAGGAGFVPYADKGGCLGVNLYVGACNLFDKHIFVGGGIGYTGVFLSPQQFADKSLSFIPIQVRFSAPLMQTEHAPALGASLGYGFSPKGIDKGGLAASVDAGWRWQMTEKSALFVGIDFALQQGKVSVAETIEGEEYESEQFRNFCRVGLKLAVQF